MDTAVLNFDGSIWPKNPGGHAGWGFELSIPGRPIMRRCGYIGNGDRMTNNVAEYHGLLRGLWLATDLEVKHLKVKGDSQLVIRHMTGEYQCKAELLLPLYKNAKEQIGKFSNIEFEWNCREKNCGADDLSKYGVIMRLEKYYLELGKTMQEALKLTISRDIVVEPLNCVLIDDSVITVMKKANQMGYSWRIIE